MPPLTIAQVTPYPWEDAHEVNAHVRALSRELRGRGHSVVVVAPSHSPALIRQSRRLIRAGESAEVLAIGELLPTLSPRRSIPSLPVDLSRALEELLERVDFDIVHVHEPWAPSASSAALRHSRALNVATFHSPTERVLSTQVARRFVETFFGRLDARVASFRATAGVLNRIFPGEYEVVLPGAEPPAPTDFTKGSVPSVKPVVHVVFEAVEERAALRVFLRALRRLPEGLDWRATVVAPGGHVPVSSSRAALRERVTVIEGEGEPDPADVVVLASSGIAPAPSVVLRALAAGAVPVVSRLPVYEELVADGEAGLVFEPSDVEVLAAQLERVIADAGLRERLRAGERARPVVVTRGRRNRGGLRAAGRAASRHGRRPCDRAAPVGTQGDRRRPAHAHRPLATTARRPSRRCWRRRATASSARSPSPTTTRSRGRSRRRRRRPTTASR